MSKVEGAADLYEAMLSVKNHHRPDAAMTFSKANAKRIGVSWEFVEDSARILGLKVHFNSGKNHTFISK